MNFLGMGPLELVLIFALALVVFGPGRLPELARQIGRTMGELRRVSSDVTAEFHRSLQTEADPPTSPVSASPPSSASPGSASAAQGQDDLKPPY